VDVWGKAGRRYGKVVMLGCLDLSRVTDGLPEKGKEGKHARLGWARIN
jgi:hypothetical protein